MTKVKFEWANVIVSVQVSLSVNLGDALEKGNGAEKGPVKRE